MTRHKHSAFADFAPAALLALAVVLTGPIAGFLAGPVAANAANDARGWPLDVALQTETGPVIPAGAWGIVMIDDPSEARLLQLRGLAGRGTIVLRDAGKRACQAFPVRFVAGDFGGMSGESHDGQPIRIVINSARLARDLRRGDDVVSDSYRISSDPQDSFADLTIATGLGDDFGFVLNPGLNFVAEVFGPAVKTSLCHPAGRKS